MSTSARGQCDAVHRSHRHHRPPRGPDRDHDPTPRPPPLPATALPASTARARPAGRMTLEEKLAQIVGFWDKGDGEAVAPLQGSSPRRPGSTRPPATGWAT